MTAETFKQQMIDRLGQGLWCLALALGLALVPAAAQTGKPDIAEQKYQLGNLLQTLGNLSLVRNANQAAQFYDEALSAYSQAEGSVEKSSFKKAIGQARIRTLCYLIGAHQAKFTPDHEQIIHLHQTNLKLFNVVMNEELPVLNLIASAYVASKNYKEAIEVYRQADSRWQAVNDQDEQKTITYANFGATLYADGQYPQAYDNFLKAQQHLEKSRHQETDKYIQLGLALSASRSNQELAKVLQYCEAATKYSWLPDERYQHGLLYNELGLANYKSGDYAASQKAYEQARDDLCDATTDEGRYNLAVAQRGVGEAAAAQGHVVEAIEQLQAAVSTWPETAPRQRTLTRLLIGQARLQAEQKNDLAQVLEDALKGLKEPSDQAAVHQAAGFYYYQLGEYTQAVASYREAASKWGNQEWRQKAITQHNLGAAFFGAALPLRGKGNDFDYYAEQAEQAYSESCRLWQQHADTQIDAARTLASLSVLYTVWAGEDHVAPPNREEYRQCAANLRKEAASSLREQGDRFQAQFKINFGYQYLQSALNSPDKCSDEAQQAGQQFQDALKILNSPGQKDRKDDRSIIRAQIGIGRAQELCQAPEAINSYQAAINRQDEATVKLAGFRRSLREESADAYQHAVELLVNQGKVLASQGSTESLVQAGKLYWDAFKLSERARARELTAQLAAINLKFKEESDDQQHRRLLDTLRKATVEYQNSGAEVLNGSPSNTLQTNHDQKFIRLERAQQAYDTFIKDACREAKVFNPKSSQLLCASGAGVESRDELKGALAAIKTVTVSYFVGSEHVIAFTFDAAGDFKEATQVCSVADFNQAFTDLSETLLKLEKHHEEVYYSLRKMYDLLIKPIDKQLAPGRVLIVPHGDLHRIPFAALMLPRKPDKPKAYFGDHHAVFHLPSVASTQSLERLEGQPDKLLALGAPDISDGRLEYTATEIQNVRSAYKSSSSWCRDDSKKDRSHCSDSADKSVWLKLIEERNFDVLHISAHGQFNQSNPEMSGLKLSSQPITVHDIDGLKTRSFRLAVLSACESSLASDSRAEERIGFAQSLMRWGAASVVASLWLVNEKSTASLMQEFHQRLTGTAKKSRGKALSTVEALQQAQRELRRNYPEPYHWAGFILTGNPGPSGVAH